MIKVIYIYWAQKFINAPEVVKKCLSSWKLHNSDWKIIELDDDNLYEYINIDMLIPEINKKEITKTSYSDIVRLFLLEKYGGCWCDATTFCNKSLDLWLNACVNDGFFAFDRPNRMDRLILSSWFLYSDKSSYIIKRWRDETIEYWNKNNKMNNYFWCHLLFNELYNTDIKFKKIWDDVGKIDTRIPHYIQEHDLLKCVCDNVKNHVKECRAPMYKLTYKFDINEYNEDCNLAYLLK
jgi:hypothetical protein